MNQQILIANGPNLGRLGAREVDVYGELDFPALVRACSAWAAELGFDASVRQTDDEAELVSWLHAAADQGMPVILNPAAFTHYSYALRDAAAEVSLLIEVHITNPASRERFRRRSVVAEVARGTIAGFGFDSYRLALEALARLRR
ncbi:MAG: 3-dehydroquinate dehydratase [Bifidobacteriaceae bacterium]|jgi:3-dehydroquinate dehydratase-2|nr:3-dehydroquinate dehydratase [Bifidobacteriaceae bacterium]